MAIRNDDVHIGTLRTTTAVKIPDFDGSTENHCLFYEMTECILNDVELLNILFIKKCVLMNTRTDRPPKNH